MSSAQDLPCGPEVIHGGRLDGRAVPGTGLTELEHQRLSTESLIEFESLWCRATAPQRRAPAGAGTARAVASGQNLTTSSTA